MSSKQIRTNLDRVPCIESKSRLRSPGRETATAGALVVSGDTPGAPVVDTLLHMWSEPRSNPFLHEQISYPDSLTFAPFCVWHVGRDEHCIRSAQTRKQHSLSSFSFRSLF